jgi:hypothetical protein
LGLLFFDFLEPGDPGDLGLLPKDLRDGDCAFSFPCLEAVTALRDRDFIDAFFCGDTEFYLNTSFFIAVGWFRSSPDRDEKIITLLICA